MDQNEHGKCGCVCHKMSGIFVALIGLDFLLGALGVISEKIVSIVWPTLVVLIGLKSSLGKGKCKCCDNS